MPTKKDWLVIGAFLLLVAAFYKPSTPQKPIPLPPWLVLPWPVPAPAPVVPVPAPVVPTPVPGTLSRKDALEFVKQADIKRYVEYFASPECAGRGTGKPGNGKAAQYIVSRLAELGVPYKIQEFDTRAGKTANIIGYLMPDKPLSDQLIVVGAHYDHLGTTGSQYYPGADDNASGTAGLMEIAEALSQAKNTLRHGVLLQFYSGEELGLLGSSYYCKNPLFPANSPDISKHAAMINLDMIGYLRASDAVTPTEMERIHGGESYENFDMELKLKVLVQELSARYPFSTRIAGYRASGSDHAPFLSVGVPVVFFHTGTHPHYHRVTDTPDRLNYLGAEQVTRLATELAWQVDNRLQ